MKLKVKTNYANQEVAYAAGSVIEVDGGMAAWLMADSPGTFEEDKPTPKTAAKGGKDEK